MTSLKVSILCAAAVGYVFHSKCFAGSSRLHISWLSQEEDDRGEILPPVAKPGARGGVRGKGNADLGEKRRHLPAPATHTRTRAHTHSHSHSF